MLSSPCQYGRLWPGVCRSVDISVWDPEEEGDESLLPPSEERGGKLLSTTASSSDDDDDDAVELSSASELKSSSCETQMLVYSHVSHPYWHQLHTKVRKMKQLI